MKTVVVCAALAMVGCASSDPVHVGGTVHGLWNGADGVALHLVADHIDTLLTVPANGAFEFPPVLAQGASYAATIAGQPFEHTCVIVHGGNGVASSDGSLDVACTGPYVSIKLAGSDDSFFDASLDQQTLPGSPFVVASTVTIEAAPGITAQLDGVPAALGAPIPRTLAVGATSFSVSFSAPDGLSRTFQLGVDRGAAAMTQDAAIRTSDVAHRDLGTAIAIDGDTMVVSAPSSNITGENDTLSVVYVFVRRDGSWQIQTRLESPDGVFSDFGHAIALSGDTLAIGGSAVLYVYTRSNGVWGSPQRLTASSNNQLALLNGGVAISSDVVVIGSRFNTVAGLPYAGEAYVFRRVNDAWTQEAVLQAEKPSAQQWFGTTVAISGDTIAVASSSFDSLDPTPEPVTVFRWIDPHWAFEQSIPRPHVSGPNVSFGAALALSGDTLVIGAPGDRSVSVGINGDETITRQDHIGAVHVYTRSYITWQRQAYLKASTQQTRAFGTSVSFSGDLLAVGAPYDSGAPTATSSGDFALTGAAFLFGRAGTTWSQLAYQKRSVPIANTAFGLSVALSADSLVVGAPSQDGSAPADADTGALYEFR